jgi:uridine kinase
VPNPKPFTVAIAGGSASGKSTFAGKLAELLAGYRPVVLNQDRYFRDWSEFTPEERDRVRTSNHPSAILWDELTQQVDRLISRTPSVEPVPGTAAAARGGPVRLLEAGDLILVEGHLILGHEPLRNLMDLMIYIDVDPHERVLRRMLRDTSKGGMTLEQAVAWYRRDVIPNYPQYTEATRRHADLIVPFEQEEGKPSEFVAAGLRDMLERRRVDATA